MSSDSEAEQRLIKSLQELLDEVTWEDIMADGFITREEMEQSLRDRGLDPYEFDYLHPGRPSEPDPPPASDSEA